MAADPGRVRDVVPVNLSRPQGRTDAAFAEHVEHIRCLIGD
jgi:NitT/TauT family transport system ATP-binding protein